METIYFLIFCLLNAAIIFWSLRKDDQADFLGQKKNKKFSLGREGKQNTPKAKD